MELKNKKLLRKVFLTKTCIISDSKGERYLDNYNIVNSPIYYMPEVSIKSTEWFTNELKAISIKSKKK